ncbi:MAG TPA: carboxypeptidase-like regulatory domain-containing protein [Edaphobacter sp.]|uniref:TonB-dependent receptor n=1 Tax=Edaphobacter sp. TaxID=1934404 RepID=UPI002C0372BC|nr:carboxypeptidase-like regulatory domain-containing protein [Edaphobacter sp.]HUZ95592.1 carboxypeptidase-like regulatory domain-containing protein [Edaphobacter sp.]
MRLASMCTALLALAAMAGVGFAQTGSVTGQVFDPAGAVVSNATVIATSGSTGLTRKAITTSAGLYNFAALPPSIYTVSVSAPGFQTLARGNVVLNIAATLPLNFTLSVAGATTSVDVQDVATAPVETDSFQLSTVVDARQINDLPLILRDPYQLVLLAPGVVTATNNVGGFSVNGQRDRNNNFMLDGADNNDTSVPGGQGGISAANPDSTQEFRVITNNFDAEFGRNTGAIIDVVTRGGSNAIHGSVYEFGRYNALGARDFFNKKENGPQDPYVRNDFGASLGGPVWKDRTFFFLNGEAQRFRTTRTEHQTTPTAAFRTGKFTYTDPIGGSQTPVDLTADPITNSDNLSGLPQNPLIAKILNLAPVGQADNGDGVSTTYFFPSPDNLNSYNLTGRFDQKLTNKHQLTVRYIYGHAAESDPLHDEVLPGYGNFSSISTAHNGVISIASSLSAHATNLVRGGYNQSNSGDFCNHAAIDALTGTDTFGNGRDINIPYFFTFGCAVLGDSNAQARLSSTILFADTFTYTRGAHSLKFGGEYRSVKDNNFDNFSSRNTLLLDNFTIFGYPSYSFYGSHSSPSVRGFEDLIWGAQGAVANSSENQFFTRAGVRRANDVSRFRQHEGALFAQDTWKVNSRFTAILGLRYAFNGVPYEKDGDLANFYGDASAAVPPAGYFTFTSVGPGTGRQLYANNSGLIEPRVGFAYDLNGDGRTAIRGGFGIFHDRVFDNLFGSAKSNPPYQAQTNDYPFDGTPDTPTVSNLPFPGELTPSANIANGQFLRAPVVIDPHLKMPTNQTYNLGIQHLLRNNLTLEVNYVGSHTTHALRALDGAPPQPNLVQAAIAAGVLPDALTFNALYTGGTDANGTRFGPMVNNNAFYHEAFETSVASGNYNALQARLSGQIGRLTLTGSYTWSHSLDNGSDPIKPGAGDSFFPRNSFNLGPEYGNSDFDVRNRGTVAATYSLPIGIGTTHLSSGLVGHLFEGIEISGIQQAQSGLPFDLRGTTDSLHTDAADRPQLIGAPYPSHRGTIVAAGKITGPSAAAFTNEPYGENLSIHRNKFYGPGFINTDVVLQKTQTLHEQVKLVFRAESYNVFNHPNLASPPQPSLTISSPTFGISQSQLGQNDFTTGARQIQAALKVIF